VARRDVERKALCLGARAKGLDLEFLVGTGDDDLAVIGGVQDGRSLSSAWGGAFVGVYASAQGRLSDNTADVDWFEYEDR
jgi:xylan 1,4-beta-xylosidase